MGAVCATPAPAAKSLHPAALKAVVGSDLANIWIYAVGARDKTDYSRCEYHKLRTQIAELLDDVEDPDKTDGAHKHMLQQVLNRKSVLGMVTLAEALHCNGSAEGSGVVLQADFVHFCERVLRGVKGDLEKGGIGLHKWMLKASARNVDASLDRCGNAATDKSDGEPHSGSTTGSNDSAAMRAVVSTADQADRVEAAITTIDKASNKAIEYIQGSLAGYSADVAANCASDTSKIVDDSAFMAALEKSGSITEIVSTAGEMASALSAVVPFVGGALKVIAWAADRYASLSEAKALLRGSVKLTRRAKHVVDSGAPLFEGDEAEYRKVVVQLMAFFACIERPAGELPADAGWLSRGKEWMKARAFDANTLRKGATLERDAHHLWQQTMEFAACLSMGSIARSAPLAASPIQGADSGESDRLEDWWRACKFKEEHGLKSFVCLMRKYLTKPCAEASGGAWISPEVWEANAKCFEDELASVDCDEDGKVSLTEVALFLDQEWAGPESNDLPILQVFAERLKRAMVSSETMTVTSPEDKRRDELAYLRSLLRAGESTVLTGHEDLAYHLEQYEEGTREWVYEPLEAWVSASSDPASDAVERLMWISGPAGMGKSVIAAKLMQRYGLKANASNAATSASRMTIAAAFFCKHNDSRRRSARQVIASLAYQLCVACDAMREAVIAALVSKQASAVSDDISGVSGMSVSDLFTLLLADPASTALSSGSDEGTLKCSSGPLVILIDALDEIEQGPDRSALLSLVATQLTRLPSRMRCVVTSRLEADITERLQGKPAVLLGSESAMAEQQQRDLRLVIERRIVKKLCSEEVTADVDAIHRVVNSLEEASDGVFVWVRLAAQALSDATGHTNASGVEGLSETEVVTAVRNGFDLDALYTENFRRVWSHIEQAAVLFGDSITTRSPGIPNQLEAVVVTHAMVSYG